eukprot:scaffold2200_cov112-Cylindrotheca_fusiformis.AAC.9
MSNGRVVLWDGEYISIVALKDSHQNDGPQHARFLSAIVLHQGKGIGILVLLSACFFLDVGKDL